MSHAICELVERDATSLWNQQTEEAQDATRLDLTTVDDPRGQEVLDRLEAAEVDVAVWDLTGDVGLPCFSASIIDRRRSPFRPLGAFAGYGCHPERGVALSRALTEAVQSRLTRVAASRDDGYFAAHRVMASGGYDASHRTRHRRPAMRSFAEVPTADRPTVDADLQDQVSRLQGVGIEQIVVVDLSRPDLGVPVVRVVIAGLEGADHSRSYAPGRRATERRSRPGSTSIPAEAAS